MQSDLTVNNVTNCVFFRLYMHGFFSLQFASSTHMINISQSPVLLSQSCVATRGPQLYFISLQHWLEEAVETPDQGKPQNGLHRTRVQGWRLGSRSHEVVCAPGGWEPPPAVSWCLVGVSETWIEPMNRNQWWDYVLFKREKKGRKTMTKKRAETWKEVSVLFLFW